MLFGFLFSKLNLVFYMFFFLKVETKNNYLSHPKTFLKKVIVFFAFCIYNQFAVWMNEFYVLYIIRGIVYLGHTTTGCSRGEEI